MNINLKISSVWYINWTYGILTKVIEHQPTGYNVWFCGYLRANWSSNIKWLLVLNCDCLSSSLSTMSLKEGVTDIQISKVEVRSEPSSPGSPGSQISSSHRSEIRLRLSKLMNLTEVAEVTNGTHQVSVVIPTLNTTHHSTIFEPFFFFFNSWLCYGVLPLSKRVTKKHRNFSVIDRQLIQLIWSLLLYLVFFVFCKIWPNISLFRCRPRR